MENKMEIPWKSHINYVRQSSHTPGYLSQVYAVNTSRRCLHSPVQSSIRHRSRGVKSAQVPGDRGMRKDNIYTKEYDSASKGRSSYHLNQPTWPGGHNTEETSQVQEDHHRAHLCFTAASRFLKNYWKRILSVLTTKSIWRAIYARYIKSSILFCVSGLWAAGFSLSPFALHSRRAWGSLREPCHTLQPWTLSPPPFIPPCSWHLHTQIVIKDMESHVLPV